MVKKNYNNMLLRFHRIPEHNGRTDGRTDRQTDRFAISRSRISVLTRDIDIKPLLQVITSIGLIICYSDIVKSVIS